MITNTSKWHFKILSTNTRHTLANFPGRFFWGPVACAFVLGFLPFAQKANMPCMPFL